MTSWLKRLLVHSAGHTALTWCAILFGGIFQLSVGGTPNASVCMSLGRSVEVYVSLSPDWSVLLESCTEGCQLFVNRSMGRLQS